MINSHSSRSEKNGKLIFVLEIFILLIVTFNLPNSLFRIISSPHVLRSQPSLYLSIIFIFLFLIYLSRCRDALSSKFSLLSVPHADGRDHHLPPSVLNSHSTPHSTSSSISASVSIPAPVIVQGDDRDWDGYPL